MNIVHFPREKHWWQKVSWLETKEVARLVGFDFESAHETYTEVAGYCPPVNRSLLIKWLLDHIYWMVHAPESHMRWEDLPERVRRWYETADVLQREHCRTQAEQDPFDPEA